MTTTGESRPRGLDMGRVIGRTFGVVGRNWRAIGLLALLVVGLPTLLFESLQLWLIAQGNTSSAGALQGLWGIVSLVLNCLLQPALTFAVVSELSGQPVDSRRAFSAGVRFLPTALGLGLLSGLGIGLGLLLLVIPGLYLMTAWAVVIPAAVMEPRKALSAFDRSTQLTRGSRMKILGLVLLLFIGIIVMAVTVGALSVGVGTLLGGGESLGGVLMEGLASSVAQMVTAVFSAAGSAVVYFELRSAKEGLGDERLLAVFD